MNKSKTIIITILTILTLILLYFHLYIKSIQLKKDYTELVSLNLYYRQKFDNLSKFIDNSFSLYKDLALTNIGLPENQENYPIVLLIIHRNSCMACSNASLQDLDILGDEIGFNKIKVITNLGKEYILEHYSGKFSYQFEFVNAELGNDLIYEEPAICVVRSSNIIQSVYYPDLFPEFKKEYFLYLRSLF